MARKQETLISDLPDYEDDTDMGKQNSLFSELNESNLLVFIIIFLILYKPSGDLLHACFTQIIPLDNQIAKNVLGALLLMILIIITKKYILS